jgi:hypothetical protein
MAWLSRFYQRSQVRVASGIVRRNIQICVRVYGKRYSRRHTYFRIVFKLLIVVELFLILHGDKRAMKRPTRGLSVWGQGWGYKHFRHFRDNF